MTFVYQVVLDWLVGGTTMEGPSANDSHRLISEKVQD